MRGKNKCGIVCKLENEEKLHLNFYMDRAVGLNHQASIRHLGIVVRDGNICPIQVLAWNKIDEDAKNHKLVIVTMSLQAQMDPVMPQIILICILHFTFYFTQVIQEDSSLSNIELFDKYFGPQRHNHVFSLGGGMRLKDVRGPIALNQELHHENIILH
ncbi:hypothetical protein ZIOFF_039407 [Zingiber officinale]|uniref:Uncharacterized protein n=1 Tax=Zingiber officinale TaxID=94328 RepID=A0A8J5L056_ZINOF|nr:hypothetical protein ZIOFF_039407 [Zingiber officinale]